MFKLGYRPVKAEDINGELIIHWQRDTRIAVLDSYGKITWHEAPPLLDYLLDAISDDDSP